jgi:carbon-monoxide dehydrogenase large subunit
MTTTETRSLIGQRMVRVEDGPLLRGRGRYVDDLSMPDALHVAFLRSPVAHGRLKGIDAAAARAAPGVHAVLTFADLRPLLTSDRIPQALPSGAIRFHVDPIVLVKSPMSANRWRWWWRTAAAWPRMHWRRSRSTSKNCRR